MGTSTETSRIHRLAEHLQEEGIDVFFANVPTTMGYLHGFWEGSHERFLTLAVRSTGEYRLICPALSESQARRAGLEAIAAYRDDEDPLVLFRQLSSDWHLKSAILAVDDLMPSKLLLAMQSVLPAALFRPGEPVLSALMRFKDEAEIRLMKRAAEIADKTLEAASAAIKPGVTELEIERVIMTRMAELGGVPTFCIVAAGANSAEGHHLTDDTVIRSGDVIVLDYGCGVEGYQSDVTHTVCCGEASDEAKKIYEIVLRAHKAGCAAAAAGVTAGDVDAAARKVISDAGYGEFFTHRTGHGIGLNVHEEPYIIRGSNVVLAPGDCFSVEPGIYLPGKLGCRIEAILTIAQDGQGVSLNMEPAETLACL